MKQVDTDIAIIGGGTAGLAAAVSAAEKGARVSIFEKASTTGGQGNMAMGPYAVESRLQKIRKIALTRDEAFRLHMDYTHWRVDARLVRAYIDKSASTIEWLENMGVEFLDVQNHNYGYALTWHVIKGTHGAAASMIKILTDRARELGAELYLQTPVNNILKKENRIVGIVAEDRTGDEIQVNTKAVVIGTGGFGDNPEMIKKHVGYEYGKDIFSIRVPGLTGDGLRMAWEAGGEATNMIMHLGSGIPNLSRPEQSAESDVYFEIVHTFRQPNLIVNLDGERFIDEAITQTTPFGGNTVALQKGRCAFMIFDEETKRYYQETGLDFPAGFLIVDAVIKISDDFDAILQQAIDEGSEHLFMANSVEDLAEKTGINLEGLNKTLAEYNKACETGHDRIFNKDPKYLRKIRKPKFYAGKLVLGGLGTLGGIRINYKTEVLNKQNDVIPGLYAAGNDANSIYGDTYMFNQPGNTLGFALNSGRIAGENAADFIKS